MLTRKKIEKLYLQCFNASEDGRTWHNHRKFARLVEAEVRERVARSLGIKRTDGMFTGERKYRHAKTYGIASAARRAAKEAR